jgi:hypothetical protein
LLEAMKKHGFFLTILAILAWMKQSPVHAAGVASLLVTVVYLCLPFVLPLPPGMTMTNGDEPHYLLLAHSLAHDHDVDLVNNYEQHDYRRFGHQEIDPHLISYHGRLISGHLMPGVPMAILPAYWLAGYAGVVAFLSLLMGVGVFCLFRSVQVSVPGPIAAGSVLFFALTYPLIIYSHQVFPETIAFPLVAFVLFQTLAPPHTPRTPRSYPVRSLSVGCALAFLPHLHYKLAPTAALLFGFFLWKHRTALRCVLGWGLPPLIVSGVLFVGWLSALVGDLSPAVFLAPLGGTFMDTHSLVDGILGLFFDQEYGLFMYAPLLVTALAGGWLLWRDQATRGDLVFMLLVYANLHVLSAGYQMWYGGLSPVPRYLIPVLPILVIWAARALTVCWEGGARLPLVLLAALQGGITLLILHNRLLMFGYEIGTNTILREVFHAHVLTAWLPSLIGTPTAAEYGRLALLVGGLLLFWGSCPRHRHEV